MHLFFREYFDNAFFQKKVNITEVSAPYALSGKIL